MKVLIVEDEMLLQMQMQMLVEDLGYEVVGPFAAVASALEALEADGADCALLDVSLRGETSWPVADALAAKGAPFALTSGRNASDIEPRFAGRPVFMKPVDENRVKRFLVEIAAARASA
jgi:CheY-like chemotaxis protein